MGAAFVLPEARKGGVFRQLSDQLHADAAQSGVRALYSLSVTHHVATQKASEALGRITVGLRLASSPAVFVEGAQPGDRITTTFNYHQVVPRGHRTLYLPERHRDMILHSYDWLGLDVTEADPSALPRLGGDDFLECHRDLTWNRALIEAAGGEAVHYKLAAFTAFLLEQGIACILLSIDLEDPSAPTLTLAAEALGYFYSGIFPESGRRGHDVLELQFLNGISLDPSQIQLHQPSAKAILAYILTLGPPCLVAANSERPSAREAPGLGAGGTTWSHLRAAGGRRCGYRRYTLPGGQELAWRGDRRRGPWTRPACPRPSPGSLVHSMGAGKELDAWTGGGGQLAAAAAEAGVERICYLGGLVPEDAATEHIVSRRDTGEMLRRGSVPLTEIRAGIVVGPGSAAFEVMRTWSCRLPGSRPSPPPSPWITCWTI